MPEPPSQKLVDAYGDELLSLLQRHWDNEHIDFVAPLKFLGAGEENLVYEFVLDDPDNVTGWGGTAIIARIPHAGRGDNNHHLARVQYSLNEMGAPAPRAIYVGSFNDGTSVIVMEKMRGLHLPTMGCLTVIMLTFLLMVFWWFDTSPLWLVFAIWVLVIGTLSYPGIMMRRIHRLDPAEFRQHYVDAGGAPERLSVGTYIDGLRSWSVENGLPELIPGVDWLEQHCPQIDDKVVCHGDCPPFNILMSKTGAASLVDWDSAVIAPREYDIAWLQQIYRFFPHAEPEMSPLARLACIVGRGLLLLALRPITMTYNIGIRVDRKRLRYFEALHMICWLNLLKRSTTKEENLETNASVDSDDWARYTASQMKQSFFERTGVTLVTNEPEPKSS